MSFPGSRLSHKHASPGSFLEKCMGQQESKKVIAAGQGSQWRTCCSASFQRGLLSAVTSRTTKNVGQSRSLRIIPPERRGSWVFKQQFWSYIKWSGERGTCFQPFQLADAKKEILAVESLPKKLKGLRKSMGHRHCT